MKGHQAQLRTWLTLLTLRSDLARQIGGEPQHLLDHIGLAVLNQATLRGEAIQSIWREPMLEPRDAAVALGAKRSNREKVRRYRARSRLLGLPSGHRFVYPAFQFDTERRDAFPEVRAVNQRLAAASDPWGVASWWFSRHARLGARPVDLVGADRAAHLGAVTEAALEPVGWPVLPPCQAPPSRSDGKPRRFSLPAGSRLTRIHSTAFSLAQFNSTVPRSDLPGSLFRTTPRDTFGLLYAADDDATAVSELLLRDLPIDEHRARLLPRIRLSDLRIGWLTTTVDLELVSLRSDLDLAALGQDPWPAAASASEYVMPRRWCLPIRRWAPWAAGLTWRPHREPDGFAYVFFSDRCPQGCFKEATDGLPVPVAAPNLDAGAGRLYVEEILSSFRVALT